MAQKFKSIWLKGKKGIIIIPVIIASISALLANTQSILNFFRNLSKKEEKKGIQIVDATFVPDTTSGKTITLPVKEQTVSKETARDKTENSVSIESNTIDIKIRNNGTETIILKEILLNIKKQWIIVPSDNNYALLEPTAKYNFAIDPNKKTPYVLSQQVSHEVEPNKSDRFLLEINLLKPILTESYIYLADVSLVYNEKDEMVTKENLIFGFFPEESKVKYPTKQILSYKDTFTGMNKIMYDTVKSMYLNNVNRINEIEKTMGIKSRKVVEFIKKIQPL